MILMDAAGLTVAGSAIGLLAAAFVTRPLAMFLVQGLKPTDSPTFIAVVVVMMLTGANAASGPAQNAVSVDPNTVLRYE